MKFVVMVVPIQLSVALAPALILNAITKGSTFFRRAFFCPVMLSLGVTSFLWQNMLTEHGMINAIAMLYTVFMAAIALSLRKAMNVKD